MKKKPEILIIGGGLSALCLAYYLSNYDVRIIESRNRLGGRIFTQYNMNMAPVEKGATWLMQHHTELIELLNELQIGTFEQKFGIRAFYEPHPGSKAQLVDLPPNGEASFRIQGGSSVLIDQLAKHINEDHISTNEIVTKIEEGQNELIVYTDKNSYAAKIVISTLPPKLFCSTIKIFPSLPETLLAVADQTHTWMSDSIKIALRFKTPFWRTENSSSTVFSNIGPVTELYDHSNFKDNTFALKGFLNSSYFSLQKEDRLEIVLKQLSKYYGAMVKEFINYEELVWRKEAFTFVASDDLIFAHQNNGHPVYHQTYLNDKLYLAGAETNAEFSGKMEAAIRSAKRVSELIIKKYSLL